MRSTVCGARLDISVSALRLGDINTDGAMELICVYADSNRVIKGVSARLPDGSVLWEARDASGSGIFDPDLPIQVFDFDGDGLPEIVYAAGDRLTVLRGRDGAVLTEAALPTGICWKALSPAWLTQGGKSDFLLTDISGNLWAFDCAARLLWRHSLPPGPFPLSADFNLDGFDEIAAGGTLFGSGGEILFSGAEDVSGLWAGYFDLSPPDGMRYLQPGGALRMLDKGGETLWKRDYGGKFRVSAAPGRFNSPARYEIVAVVSGEGTPDRLELLDMGGTLLAEREMPSGGMTCIDTIRNFDDTFDEHILLWQPDGGRPPVLLNGRLEAAFGGLPDGICLHADITGCGTEDIIVLSRDSIGLFASSGKDYSHRGRHPLRQTFKLSRASALPCGMPEASPLKNERPVPVINAKRGSGPVIFLMGDSTVCDQPSLPFYGWGQALPEFFNDSVNVSNYAVSGRAAKSFIWEGHYAAMRRHWRSGDFVLIQFGHNDQKPENDSYSEAFGDYCSLLCFFAREALSAGITPVLISSMERRFFDKNGEVIHSHGDYPEACRKAADELGILCIDLNAESKALYKSYGVEGSKQLFVHEAPGVLADFPDGIEDNTHFRYKGAREIAAVICREIRGNLPQLARFLLI